MAGLVFFVLILLVFGAFVAWPEWSRRRRLRGVREAVPAKILRPPGHRRWQDNGTDYDKVYR